MEDTLTHLIMEYAVAVYVGDEKQKEKLRKEIVAIRRILDRNK